MKRIRAPWICLMLLMGFLLMPAAGVSSAQEQRPADIREIVKCPFCGMDRMQWAHSRMLIVYNDGSKTGTCSLRCAVVDLVNNIDKSPENIFVGDYNSKKLIDAEHAHWVIGGDKPGVMTKRAKWAFEDRAAAQAFIKAHGGEPAEMDKAIEAAFMDINADTKMIRERRRMKRERMKHSKTGAGH